LVRKTDEADATSNRLVVAVSYGMDARHVETLRGHFPFVEFQVLEKDGVVPKSARGSRVLLRTVMTLDALETAVSQLPQLEWVHTSTAGFNWAMTPSVVSRRIKLTRTADVLGQPIAEHALTLALALLRRLPELTRAQQAATWIRPALRVLSGRTVVIIGAGSIGRESAKRFKALGCRVLGLSRSGTQVPGFDDVAEAGRLRDLLPEADVLLIACPLTPETHGLLGEPELSLMKPDAIIVNVARGEIISEGPLLEALRNQRISGAALDVFSVEPLPPESEFWRLPNVIVSPHCAFMAPGNLEGVLVEFMQNLDRFVAGEPLENELRSWELGY
jgi:phosphoglycerate dehydrogenase-like enzyme